MIERDSECDCERPDVRQCSHSTVSNGAGFPGFGSQAVLESWFVWTCFLCVRSYGNWEVYGF